MRTLATILFAAVIVAVAPIASAQSARPADCPEGRKFDGSCVDPELAKLSRLSVVVRTQPKISHTQIPALLPSKDREFPILRDWHELRELFY
jgi:hypothetical protein